MKSCEVYRVIKIINFRTLAFAETGALENNECGTNNIVSFTNW